MFVCLVSDVLMVNAMAEVDQNADQENENEKDIV